MQITHMPKNTKTILACFLTLVFILSECLPDTSIEIAKAASSIPSTITHESMTLTFTTSPQNNKGYTVSEYNPSSVYAGTISLPSAFATDSQGTQFYPLVGINSKVFQDAILDSVSLQGSNYFGAVGGKAFYRATVSQNLEIGRLKGTIYTSAFENITVGGNLVIKSTAAIAIKDRAFAGADIAGTITLPYLSSVGNYAFRETKIKTYRFHTVLTDVGTGIFEDCASLSKIYMPEEDHEISVAEDAFPNKEGLVFVIPEGLTDLSPYHFENYDQVIFQLSEELNTESPAYLFVQSHQLLYRFGESGEIKRGGNINDVWAPASPQSVSTPAATSASASVAPQTVSTPPATSASASAAPQTVSTPPATSAPASVAPQTASSSPVTSTPASSETPVPTLPVTFVSPSQTPVTTLPLEPTIQSSPIATLPNSPSSTPKILDAPTAFPVVLSTPSAPATPPIRPSVMPTPSTIAASSDAINISTIFPTSTPSAGSAPDPTISTSPSDTPADFPDALADTTDSAEPAPSPSLAPVISTQTTSPSLALDISAQTASPSLTPDVSTQTASPSLAPDISAQTASPSLAPVISAILPAPTPNVDSVPDPTISTSPSDTPANSPDALADKANSAEPVLSPTQTPNASAQTSSPSLTPDLSTQTASPPLAPVISVILPTPSLKVDSASDPTISTSPSNTPADFPDTPANTAHSTEPVLSPSPAPVISTQVPSIWIPDTSEPSTELSRISDTHDQEYTSTPPSSLMQSSHLDAIVSKTPLPSATASTKTKNHTTTKAAKIFTKKGIRYQIAAGKQVKVIGLSDQEKSTLTIPTVVTINKTLYKVTAINKKAFYGNKNLYTVTIGDYVRTIGESAFAECTNMRKIHFGSSLQTLEKNALRKDGHLKKIIFDSKKIKKIGKQAFEGVPTDTDIRVIKSCQKKYQRLINASRKL